MEETPSIQNEAQIYLDWIDFVKPKLCNMVKVLREQYGVDKAPENWVDWSVGKTNGLIENDLALVGFVEYFLKQFWILDQSSQTYTFDLVGFTQARNDSIKHLIAKGGLPQGLDLSYEPSDVAKEKIGLYMAMLCDSHEVMVKNKLEF